MKHQVIVTPEAQAGIREAFAYIHQRSTLNAGRWLRQLVFNSHRVVFTVRKKEKRVHVLYLRHSRPRAVGEIAEDEVLE